MATLQSLTEAMRSLAPDAESASGAAWRIYEDLRRRIVNLVLPPDTTLNRAKLAAEFDVSQMPVREALQLLEQDGLVRIYPQSRTVVARISVRELHETQFLRVALETEVMRQVAKTPAPAMLTRARSILAMMETLGTIPEEMPLFHDLDRDFHGVFFAALDMQGLHRMLVRRLGHLARCQRLELPLQGKMAQVLAAHREILDTVAAGDPTAAAAAMERHITGTINRISVLRETSPELFTEK